ncbi:MAG: hypothetical protein ABJF23_20860 [Bryobacteraceae bacterium]
MVRPILALFLFAVAASSADQSSKVALSPPLAQWKAEIEATGKTTVVLARVFTDAGRNELTLPSDAEFRPFLRSLLQSEAFVAQFVQTHAINVNSHTGLRPISVVLLNMARAADWDGQEEAVIAHELGHIWLHASGYPAPQAARGLSCEAVHSGDMVQHILIREQMRARRIAFLPFWRSTLESALAEMQEAPGDQPLLRADRCRRISRLALWVDVALGMSDRDWSRRPEFLDALRSRFPELRKPTMAITTLLRGHNLQDRAEYQRVMNGVLSEVHRLER